MSCSCCAVQADPQINAKKICAPVEVKEDAGRVMKRCRYDRRRPDSGKVAARSLNLDLTPVPCGVVVSFRNSGGYVIVAEMADARLGSQAELNLMKC